MVGAFATLRVLARGQRSGRAQRAKTNAVYFISPPGGIFVPTLSISASGCILSEVSGAWPVVAGPGWSVSGFAAAAGLSDFSAFRGEWGVPYPGARLSCPGGP